MTASVITPLSRTGNRYIQEVYRSLAAQSLQDWEWVVLENHGGRLPLEITADPRVKVYREEHEGVGALKRRACDLATGDLLVEIDHDDLVPPHALECLVSAHRGTRAEFLYSNFAEFEDHPMRTPITYPSQYGWSHRPEPPFAKFPLGVVGLAAGPMTPQHLLRIEFSPNHVRAWNAAAYRRLGGHSPAFPVGDDYDIITRWWEQGARFEHVDETLYYYRVHDANTVKARQQEIYQAVQQVQTMRTWSILERWGVETGRRLLDIANHGQVTPRNFESVEGWCLAMRPSDSAAIIRATTELHRLDLVEFMTQAYRVLMPGGWLMISTPTATSSEALGDPLARSRWSAAAMDYFTKAAARVRLPQCSVRFHAHRVFEWHPTDWHRSVNSPWVDAELIAVKGDYHPMGYVET